MAASPVRTVALAVAVGVFVAASLARAEPTPQPPSPVDPDRDPDGIANSEDSCPAEPETWNGVLDWDGCADLAGTKYVADGCVTKAACEADANAAWMVSDWARGAKTAQRACNLGAFTFCAALGTAVAQGQGTEKNSERARELYAWACDHRAPAGCYNLGVFYATGTTVAVDTVEGKRLQVRACELGLASACKVLGMPAPVVAPPATVVAPVTATPPPDPLAPARAAHERKDYATAKKLYRPLCDGGNVQACAALGDVVFDSGNEAGAVLLWEKACNGRVAYACTEVASGHLARANQSAAARNLAIQAGTKACDLGDGDGCLVVADATTPLERRSVWFERACALNLGDGCAFAAHSARQGDFGPRNAAAAVRFGEKACTLGNWIECAIAGHAFANGTDVARDPVKAKQLYTTGCDHGDAPACKALGKR